MGLGLGGEGGERERGELAYLIFQGGERGKKGERLVYSCRG